MTDPTKFSQPFLDMAARIEKNDPAEFSGAMLIVPPTGEPVAVMITDPSKDVEGFLAHCTSKLQIAVAEVMQGKQGNGPAWPAGRR